MLSPLSGIALFSLRWLLHIEATQLPVCHFRRCHLYACHAIVLLVTVLAIFSQAGMANRQLLRTIAFDCKNILCKTVRCLEHLFVETLLLVFPVDGDVHEGRDDGLRVPVREPRHYKRELFI